MKKSRSEGINICVYICTHKEPTVRHLWFLRRWPLVFSPPSSSLPFSSSSHSLPLLNWLPTFLVPFLLLILTINELNRCFKWFLYCYLNIDMYVFVLNLILVVCSIGLFLKKEKRKIMYPKLVELAICRSWRGFDSATKACFFLWSQQGWNYLPFGDLPRLWARNWEYHSLQLL